MKWKIFSIFSKFNYFNTFLCRLMRGIILGKKNHTILFKRMVIIFILS